MTHDHKHEHCCHERLAYCPHCRVVYCKGCGKEWHEQLNWTLTSAGTDIYTIPCGSLGATWKSGNTIDLTPQITCNHAG